MKTLLTIIALALAGCGAPPEHIECVARIAEVEQRAIFNGNPAQCGNGWVAVGIEIDTESYLRCGKLAITCPTPGVPIAGHP